MKTATATIATALAFVYVCGSTSASAQCRKWQNQLAPGEQSSHYPGRRLPTQLEQDASLARERFYYSKLYSDEADEACQKAARYSSSGIPGPSVVIKSEYVNDDTYTCYVDVDNDDQFRPELGQDLFFQDVARLAVQTEPCCQYDSNDFPNAPHAIDPDVYYKTDPVTMMVAEMAPAPGLSFQGSDVHYGGVLRVSPKAQFIAQNALMSPVFYPNTVRSDLAGFDVDPAYMSDNLTCAGAPGSGAPDGSLWYQRGVSTHNPCAAEVDHIIPRVDVHGCACGSNSSKNAQLISRRLNNWLSNDCNPKRPAGRARLKIIDGYNKGNLPLPPPMISDGPGSASENSPTRFPPDDIQAAPGCSSAGESSRGSLSGVFSLIVLGVLPLVRRRRDA